MTPEGSFDTEHWMMLKIQLWSQE